MTQPKRSLSRFPHAKLFIYTYIDARQSYDLDPVAPQACTTVNQIPTHFLSFFFFDFFSLFSFLSFLLRRLSLTHAGTHINAHAHAKHKLTNTHMRASVTFGTDVQHTNNTHTRTHTHTHTHLFPLRDLERDRRLRSRFLSRQQVTLSTIERGVLQPTRVRGEGASPSQPNPSAKTRDTRPPIATVAPASPLPVAPFLAPAAPLLFFG